MKTLQECREAINHEFGEFIMYRASEQMRTFVRLLDAMIDEKFLDLVDISPASLEKKQGALQQLISIRQGIIDPERAGIVSV